MEASTSLSVLRTIRAAVVDRVIISAYFRAICPVTKTVDEYDVTIEYVPNEDGVYVELESLRKYLDSFEGVEIFHEDLTARLAERLVEAIRPKYLAVSLRSRFLGMTITVIKEWRTTTPTQTSKTPAP